MRKVSGTILTVLLLGTLTINSNVALASTIAKPSSTPQATNGVIPYVSSDPGDGGGGLSWIAPNGGEWKASRTAGREHFTESIMYLNQTDTKAAVVLKLRPDVRKNYIQKYTAQSAGAAAEWLFTQLASYGVPYSKLVFASIDSAKNLVDKIERGQFGGAFEQSNYLCAKTVVGDITHDNNGNEIRNISVVWEPWDGKVAIGEPGTDGNFKPFNKITGWQNVDGKFYFLRVDGTIQRFWLNLDGKFYYFNDQGIMQTGWVKYVDRWFFLESNGVMQTGWIRDNGNFYYLDSDGRAHIGWLKYDGYYYYFDKDSYMKLGWQLIDNNWYYFDESSVDIYQGKMKTGWLYNKERWYFLNDTNTCKNNNLPEGAMLKGQHKIGDKLYYFDEYGQCTNP